jgi:ABC-type nitrate/sulfonate/bicarbonate transport system ATPase subunit
MEDGWSVKRRANHGLFLTRRFGETVRVTVVKDTTASIPTGTLSAILGPRQTGLGRSGLARLLERRR